MLTKKITVSAVENIRNLSPRRCRFSENSPTRTLEDGTCFVSIRFPSLVRLFKRDTNIGLHNGKYSYYRKISDPREINTIRQWQNKHQRYIFLRDTLDCSVALDYNFADRGRYTDLGLAEYNAKDVRHKPSIDILAKACVRAISDISIYRDADVVCAVPPSPEKEWDLPTEIVRIVSEKTGKPNISAWIQFRATKKSIKGTPLVQKWSTLEAGEPLVQHIPGYNIILIDDKYQSGMTAQFVASKLYQAGAEEVNGLFCIKTWRDTDNQ
jgi:hypothetical protein